MNEKEKKALILQSDANKKIVVKDDALIWAKKIIDDTGIEPVYGDIMIYSGKPYITASGWNRISSKMGEKTGIPKLFENNMSASNPYVIVEYILTTNKGKTIKAFGSCEMIEAGKPSRPRLQDRLGNAETRARNRACRIAYGDYGTCSFEELDGKSQKNSRDFIEVEAEK